MSNKTDFNKLKKYFNSLTTPGKKEFIQNLKEKISDVKDSKYLGFLNTCIRQYNEEVAERAKKKSPEEPKTKPLPDISPEAFARAFSVMLFGEEKNSQSMIKHLLGKWQRVSETGTHFFDFKENGTFDTNETSSGAVLTGNYSTGLDGVLLLEPKEELGIINVLLSQNNLLLYFSNGSAHTYTKLTVPSDKNHQS